MVNVTQGAFNAGVLSEGMFGRPDTEKYQKGLRDALNMFVLPQGGVSNRAGFAAVTRFDTGGADERQYLVPFQYSTTQTYVLEFTDEVFRVISDGGYVLDTAVGELSVAAVTAASGAAVELDDAADAAQLAVGDLVYLTDANGDHALHATTLRVSSIGGATIGFTVYDGEELDTTDAAAWGETGVGATLQKVYSQTHTLAGFTEMRHVQDADTLYIVHKDHPPAKVGRLDHDEWTFQNVSFGAAVGVTDTKARTVTGATRTNPVVITLAGHDLTVGDSFRLTYVEGMTQLNNRIFTASDVTLDTVTLATGDGDPVDGTGYSAYTSGGRLRAPAATYTRGDDVDGSDLTTYTYAVAVIDEDTYEEGLPSDEFTVENDLYYEGSKNFIGWPAVEGASRYKVYRKSAGALAYIGSTTSTHMLDDNITPDTAQGPQLAREPFTEEYGYPSVVAFYEQRLVFAATADDPQLVEMSRVGALENFNGAYPSLPDDACSFRMRSGQVNEVLALVARGDFTILTSGGEWALAGQGDGTYVRPDKRNLAPLSAYGTAALEPIDTGTVVLFVEPSGSAVREYRGAGDSTPPQDLTVIAADLFEDRRIVSWAYAAAPNKIVWAVCDDGSLRTLTYMPEHDVWGWTRHELGGDDARARQVVVIREDYRDIAYMVVERTVDSRTVTTVERERPRNDTDVVKGYFVDGGAQIEATEEVGSVSGLLHLRGQTLTALVDGDVVNELIVDATGTVDLRGFEGTHVSVGLPYESLIQTLDVRLDNQTQGTSEGTFKAASRVAVKMKRTRGVAAGTTLDQMNEIKEWSAPLVGAPIPLRTATVDVDVSGDWVREATMYVRQQYPLPMTILSLTPDWERGE